MKKLLTKIILPTLLLTAVTGVSHISAKSEPVSVSALGADSYWSTVDSKANADTLFTKISALSRASGPSGESGYDQLWEKYQTTDIVPGTNKIWDMYGGFQFTYQSKGSSSNSPEGASYNREHSIPKSWFNTEKDERYCDVVHLVPTDCQVNNRRGNWAFGEVENATYVWKFSAAKDGYGNTIQTAGCSKLGNGKSINGVNAPSTVFEPDDQYKGDFARIYYYFATRYGPQGKSATSDNGSAMFSDSANDFYMTPYGKALMNKWHVQDPVSKKELDRNDGIEATQGNRNPYVDHPEWADKIFGSNYVETHGQADDTPSIEISASKTSIKIGETVTLSASKKNLSGTANWYFQDGSTDVASLSTSSGDSVVLSGLKEGTVTVCANIGTVYDSIVITVTSSGGSTSTLFAEANKTFYVGDTISSSDITVKNSLGSTVSGFVFANNGYKFTYEDATSGGELTNKTFSNAITYSSNTCSLTVQVQRKARETSSTSGGLDTLVASDLVATDTSYKDSIVTKSSGATYIAQSAKDNSGNIQMRSKNNNSGIVTSVSGGNVCKIKITVGSGSNEINIYGKNSAYTAVTDLYNSANAGTMIKQISSTSTFTLTTTYPYIGIRSNNGAIYLKSIEITYEGSGASNDTASNVANYIMYEDTVGQCATKFPNAKEYFENLSVAERNIFMTSDDYVISKARERLIAWAKSIGSSIMMSGETYVITPPKSSKSMPTGKKNVNTKTIIIVGASICAIGLLIYLKRKFKIKIVK